MPVGIGRRGIRTQRFLGIHKIKWHFISVSLSYIHTYIICIHIYFIFIFIYKEGLSLGSRILMILLCFYAFLY